MPIKNPSRSIGSSRTTAKVYIYRHNRYPYSNHGEVDISQWVTQCSMGNNISGGGVLTLHVAPVLPWEDEFAPNDIVNLYFNTNRPHERFEYEDGDATWRYNLGNVRTFFGYVSTITRQVIKTSDGSRNTRYSIVCNTFDKAIRATSVYTNPHLTYQGDADSSERDVVREDIRSNIGGLLLLQKGFLVAGSPRKLIISHLMRSLGFGGQWLLPLGYEDDLYKQNFVAKFSAEKNSEKDKEITKLDYKYTVEIKSQERKSSPGTLSKEQIPFIANTKFTIPNDTIPHQARHVSNGVLDDLKDALVQVATEARIKHWSVKNYLFEQLNGGLSKDDLGNLEETANGEVYFTQKLYDANYKKISEKMGIFQLITKGGKKVFKFVPNPKVIEELYNDAAPELTPKVNQETKLEGYTPTPAKTMFNILCLDYMEEVDGNYVLSQMFNFGGPLLDQLIRQSNSLIAELYFDLRPAPDFTQHEKDGLGKELDGAIPMVPAVVLREKPFTIYKDPNVTIAEPDKNNIVTSGKEVKYGNADQLFIKLFHRSGYSKIKAKDTDKVNTILKDNGYDELALPTKSTPEFLDKYSAYIKTIPKTPSGNSKPEGESPTYSSQEKYLASKYKPNIIDEAQIVGYKAVSATEYGTVGYVADSLSLAEQPYNVMFSLPRPVFKSPDGGRLTLESNVASQDTILGVLEKQQIGTAKPKIKFQPIPTYNQGGITPESIGSNKEFTQALNFGADPDSAKFIKSDILKQQQLNKTKQRWHVLDKITIKSEDIITEQYYRSDGEVINILELFGDVNPDFEFQKAVVSDKLPLVTPISIQRGGVRVSSHVTSFLQHLLSGGGTNAWLAGLAYRWVVMMDMWSQHNHELLTGTLTLRGMPGLRVGYKIDRPELGLSFYVDSVSHEWTYPGNMTTSISISRGQPTQDESRVLDYIPHEPKVHSNKQKRQWLGRQFSVHDKVVVEGDKRRNELEQPIIHQPVSTIDLKDKL